MSKEKEFDVSLLDLVHSGTECARKYAAKELGLTRDLRATQGLIRALKTEESFYVKASIVWALRQIGSPRAITPLIDELKDQDEYEREIFAYEEASVEASVWQWEREAEEQEDRPCSSDGESLPHRERSWDSRDDDEVGEAESDEDIDDYEYRQRAYEMAGDEEEPPDEESELRASEATEMAEEHSSDEEECHDARQDPEEDFYLQYGSGLMSPADALISFGSQAFDPLVAALDDQNAMIRRNVIIILAHFEDPRSRPAVLEATEDWDEVVRANEVEAIKARLTGDFVTFDCYRDRILHVSKDRSSLVRTNTVEAMDRYKHPSVFIGSFIAALKDDDAVVRAEAACALGQPGRAKAIEPLIQAMKDKDEIVRSRARDALVEIGPEVIVPLITALETEIGRELDGAEDRRESNLENKDDEVTQQPDWGEDIPL